MTLFIWQRKPLINVSIFEGTTCYQERTCIIMNKYCLTIERAMIFNQRCLPCKDTLFIEMESQNCYRLRRSLLLQEAPMEL
jgi:hypothetical protein